MVESVPSTHLVAGSNPAVRSSQDRLEARTLKRYVNVWGIGIQGAVSARKTIRNRCPWRNALDTHDGVPSRVCRVPQAALLRRVLRDSCGFPKEPAEERASGEAVTYTAGHVREALRQLPGTRLELPHQHGGQAVHAGL